MVRLSPGPGRLGVEKCFLDGYKKEEMGFGKRLIVIIFTITIICPLTAKKRRGGRSLAATRGGKNSKIGGPLSPFFSDREKRRDRTSSHSGNKKKNTKSLAM